MREKLTAQAPEVTLDCRYWLCQYLEEHGGGTALFFDGSIGGLLSTLGDDVALQDHDTGEVAKDGTWKKAELFLINGGITRFPGADYPDAPFEPTVREHLKSKYQFVFGLADDELGYIIPKAEWDNEPPWLLNKKDRWYGEINSAGPEIAGAVTRPGATHRPAIGLTFHLGFHPVVFGLNTRYAKAGANGLGAKRILQYAAKQSRMACTGRVPASW